MDLDKGRSDIDKEGGGNGSKGVCDWASLRGVFSPCVHSVSLAGALA